MAAFWLRSCYFFTLKNLLPLRFFVLICGAVLCSVSFLWRPAQAMAAAPPTGENAYCGKGNVAQFGSKDGVAELPKACYYTGLDGTPSPGKQIRIEAKADLASSVDHAKCGDTLLLPAGSSFDVSAFPSKKCDDQHYITIRTDAPDSKLPAEGTRISPAWAGVASLPGRPPFSQPAGGPAKLLAVIVAKRPAGVTVGDHVRFIGIEWTTPPGADISRMVSVEHGDHIIFDRNWVHPAEGTEVAHGISFIDGAQMVAVVNSYISGLNCIARTGKCTDATAVSGGKGDETISTIKIYNNFLESSGENILFGGSAATQVPTDLEIRRNHLFRPVLWKEGQPGYTAAASGQAFIVKNNFELKSAIRVLFEANLLENTWGGFSQTGYSILLTPKSQQNQCPVCRVNDVTIRFNRIRNVAGVFQIANSPAKTGGFAADGGRYSIHDVVADDVHDKDYKGPGNFLVLVSWEPALHDIQIDHVTAFVTGKLLAILNPGAKLKNFSITNSVFSVGADRPISSAGGGPESCAGKTQAIGGQAVLESCFDPYKFENNLIISGRGSFPKGNFIVGSAGDAGIRELKDTVAKDPHLCHEKGPGCSKISRGAGSASDGRDLGADIDAVEAAITGIE
jgi:hypothetical protein